MKPVKIYRSGILLLLILGLLIFVMLMPPGYLTRILTALVSHRLLIVLLSLFALLALSMLWTAGHAFDLAGFRWFNNRGERPAWLDRLMWALTQIGSGLGTLALAGIFFFVHQRRLSFILILGMITLSMTVETIKTITERNRPFFMITETRVIGGKARGLSFPSGHTAQSFFLAALLSGYFQVHAVWTALLFVVALAVGVTRMYVGAHYPRDVIGGAILGLVWGVVTAIVVT